MNLNISSDMLGRFLEAFKAMGLDDKMVGQALQQAGQQPSAFRFHVAVQAGASKFASKFARKAKTASEQKEKLQKAQKSRTAQGGRRAVPKVKGIAADFEKHSGGRLKQWQLVQLFEDLDDEETVDSVEKKLARRLDETDPRTVQQAYSFLEQALPSDDPVLVTVSKAAVEHRRIYIAEITVSSDLEKGAAELQENGITNLATPEQLKEFFDHLLDEMADPHRDFDVWTKQFTHREFKIVAKVTSHMVGEKIHDVDPLMEKGLMHALTVGINKLRIYDHAHGFFAGRQRLMRSMCDQYGVEIPSHLMLQSPKERRRR